GCLHLEVPRGDPRLSVSGRPVEDENPVIVRDGEREAEGVGARVRHGEGDLGGKVESVGGYDEGRLRCRAAGREQEGEKNDDRSDVPHDAYLSLCESHSSDVSRNLNEDKVGASKEMSNALEPAGCDRGGAALHSPSAACKGLWR